MFTLYVPLYETDERTIKSELATFFAAFPYGTVWANTVDGQGYDMVFMGQAEPLKIDLDEVQRRLDRPDYAPVAQSLRDIGVNSAIDLFATYAGQKSDLGPWADRRGAQPRRRSAAAISRRMGHQLGAGRLHLPPDDELPPASLEHLHGNARAPAGAGARAQRAIA